MNKEVIKNLKVFALSALLTSSIVLSGCNSSKALNDYSDEEIKEEYERRSKKEVSNNKGTQTKIFEPGQHVIENVQLYGPYDFIDSKRRIECPDGYELISTWSYRINDNKYFGYIYSNTLPVEAKSDENGEYTDFGTPIGKEKNEQTQKVKTK